MFLLALSIAHQCTKDLFNVHSQIYSAGHVFNIYTRILPPNIFGDPNLSFRKKCKISECRQCKILKSYNVCPDLRGVLQVTFAMLFQSLSTIIILFLYVHRTNQSGNFPYNKLPRNIIVQLLVQFFFRTPFQNWI